MRKIRGTFDLEKAKSGALVVDDMGIPHSIYVSPSGDEETMVRFAIDGKTVFMPLLQLLSMKTLYIQEEQEGGETELYGVLFKGLSMAKVEIFEDRAQALTASRSLRGAIGVIRIVC